MRVTKKVWFAVGVLIALAAVLAPPAKAGSHRLYVEIDEPFEVCGQRFEPGRLTLRELDTFNPVTTLNEIQVDGVSAGVVFGVAVQPSTPARRDELTFTRSADGVLVLQSIAFSGDATRRVAAIGVAPSDTTASVLTARR
jgi:hypothetical protein